MQQEIEEFTCTVCNKQFKLYTTLKRHQGTHNLFCDKCNRNFKNVQQKKQHDRTNHPQIKERRCRVCPELSFKTEEEYLLHIRDIHKGKFVDCYMCNVCGKTFKTRSELTQHINSKCGTERQFTCKVCGQKLMTPGSLYNHMRRHNDSASFMCRFCAKLFLTAGQLKVHERIHTQQKDFVCNVCGKGFCHRQSLITHSSVHTGIKPYQCEGCGKSFSCVGNLLKHRKTHADSCGLLPLTTHRVQHPSTKIKVRINTPASSKLKKLMKNKELEKKFAMLDSKLGIDEKIDNLEEIASPQKTDELSCITQDNVASQDKDVLKNLEASTNCIKEICDNSDIDNIFDDNDDNTSMDYNEPTECDNMQEEGGSEEFCSKDDSSGFKEESNFKSGDKLNRRIHCKRKRDPLFDTKFDAFIKERKLESAKSAACKYCNKKYTQFRWLYKHEQVHEINDNVEKGEVKSLPFKCSCCKKCFETKEEVKQHQQIEHLDILIMDSHLRNLLKTGIEESKRKELLNRYSITDQTLIPPKLNPDIQSCLSEVNLKEDSVLSQFQNQLANGLSALNKIFHRCEKETADQANIKEEIIDSIKIFADLYHQLFLHRKNNIIPHLDIKQDILKNECSIANIIFSDSL